MIDKYRPVISCHSRQLSVEKSELEQNVAQSNKIADRMSKNVEQLQWRIKNKFDVPVGQLTSEHLILDDLTSLSERGPIMQQLRWEK